MDAFACSFLNKVVEMPDISSNGRLEGQNGQFEPVNEKLTISPSLTYMNSNVELKFIEWEVGAAGDIGEVGETLWVFEDETDAYEIDVEGTYNITDAFTYAAGVAWASIDFDQGGMVDPEDVVKFWHSFTLSF